MTTEHNAEAAARAALLTPANTDDLLDLCTRWGVSVQRADDGEDITLTAGPLALCWGGSLAPHWRAFAGERRVGGDLYTLDAAAAWFVNGTHLLTLDATD